MGSSKIQANPMRIYICGPMTGLPEFNWPAFHEEAARLRALGYHVENPAENDPPPCGSWEGWMRKAIAKLLTCDAVSRLDGWENSRGARIESMIAETLRMPIVSNFSQQAIAALPVVGRA